jgi:hypothetical protein
VTTVWLLGAVRYALGLTLAAAAVGKVRDVGAFRVSLAGYGLYGWTAWAAALALIVAEGVAAVVTFLPHSDVVVGVLATSLGLLFLSSQVYVLASGRRATCLCFGRSAAEPVSARTATRAALVLAAGLVLLVARVPGARPLDVLAVTAAVALVGVAHLGLRTMDG